MFSPQKRSSPPVDYEFPFEPYAIQQQLMEAVYQVLTNKSIGIFESPTGTGKSLTLTCSVLRWLEDYEDAVRRELVESIKRVEQEVRQLSIATNSASDWITANFELGQRRNELTELQQLQRLLVEHEERLKEVKKRQVEKKKTVKRVMKPQENNVNETVVDLEWEAEELNQSLSDEEGTEKDEEAMKESEAVQYRPIKIFFCSRTHSQLTQVVNEVKRSAYGQRVRCISLASRQQFCIHPHIRKLPSVNLINERCLDLKKKSTSAANSTSCCDFRKAAAVQDLSEAALVRIMDIEDLVKEGKESIACPYYASRAASQSAQLIMLPYQMLLHRRTRLQMGIDLHGAIVVIDEAHNLLDTIAQLHSCELTLEQLTLVQKQLSAYKMRYVKRFSTANLLRINQLLFVVKRLSKMLQAKPSDASGNNRMLRTYEVAAEGEFYNINLVELLQFCEHSRLAQKLQGFAEVQNREETKDRKENEPSGMGATQVLLQQLQKVNSKQKLNNMQEAKIATDASEFKENSIIKTSSAPLRSLLAFMESLTENAEDGRVLLRTHAAGDPTQSSYKYILLNPGGHFEDIVRDARAIIVAGGTMQPTAELTDQLFRTCMDRVKLHFYDHVVDSNAVLPFVVTQGPSGQRICFNYAQRNNENMLLELGMILQNICHVVPAGLVCFLPSYDYLDTVYQHLQKTGILERISDKKHIFSETRSTANGATVDQLLADYRAAIKSGTKGALIFSVIGGKLSEGLNFADDLGRGVLVVGMPYPNRQSVELQERMKYLDSTLGTGAGNEYYENLCMKAVNQCIGRSIRHIRDYACVYLVDERYSKKHIQDKLPQWIARNLKMTTSFGVVQSSTAKFFKGKV